MDEKLKKALYFDANNPEQVRIFNILDKVRYSQTKLISKLLGDFFDKYGITESTSYDKVKMIVKLYIDGESSEIPSSTPAVAQPTTSSILEQQLNMCNMLMASLLSQQNRQAITPISIGTTPVANNIFSNDSSKNNNESDKLNFVSKDEPEQHMFDDSMEQNNDEDDENLSKMVFGFQSMIE